MVYVYGSRLGRSMEAWLGFNHPKERKHWHRDREPRRVRCMVSVAEEYWFFSEPALRHLAKKFFYDNIDSKHAPPSSERQSTDGVDSFENFGVLPACEAARMVIPPRYQTNGWKAVTQGELLRLRLGQPPALVEGLASLGSPTPTGRGSGLGLLQAIDLLEGVLHMATTEYPKLQQISIMTPIFDGDRNELERQAPGASNSDDR